MPQAALHVVAESEIQTELNGVLERQRQAYATNMYPSVAQRLDALKRLERVIKKHQGAIIAAMNDDFGNRAKNESLMLEIFSTLEGIRDARRHLRKWMRPKARPVSIWFLPARAEVRYQPLGVVGIIVPWNYPLYLATGPLIAALAAGNRAMVKMSEFTPRMGELFKSIMAEAFSEDEVAVINGSVEVAQAFSRLPFDHLLFTGSTSVGKIVMRAASEHLTPVTLELGGKSPTLIGPDANLKTAVERTMAGKCFNAGQTCVAPDYVLVPRNKLDEFVALAKAQIASFYPSLTENDDYTSIINQGHFQRLNRYLDEAKDQGAQVIPLTTDGKPLAGGEGKLAPTIVVGASDEMTVMQDEIFGPILPIQPYDSLEEAIAYINDRPRPLALYYFGKSRHLINRVLNNTISGGVSINDTVMHVGVDSLPFGGVGPSGMGHYHGEDGFVTFSKKKGIFYQAPLASIKLLYPPFGKLASLILKIMIR